MIETLINAITTRLGLHQTDTGWSGTTTTPLFDDLRSQAQFVRRIGNTWTQRFDESTLMLTHEKAGRTTLVIA